MISRVLCLLIALLAASCSRSTSTSKALPSLTLPKNDTTYINCSPANTSSSSLAALTGNVLITGNCVYNGDLNLSGNTSITIQDANFTLNGNVSLADSSSIHVMGGLFNLANRLAFQYSITAKDQSVFEMNGSELKTNAGVVSTSLAASFIGHGNSLLKINHATLNTAQSWLLASFYDSSALQANESPSFPNESYPYDSSTLTISGPSSNNTVWLDFSAGSNGTLSNIPPSMAAPSTYSFGRNTPTLTNVRFEIDVLNGLANLNVASHPGSSVTISNNVMPLAINYYIENATSAENVTGLQSGGTQTLSLSNQGRTLSLNNAKLGTYTWQIYAKQTSVPVSLSNSTINEIGAFTGGSINASNVNFQFATISSVGQDSVIHVNGSSIQSQSIVAQANGQIQIQDSTIFGSLIQATGQASIVLLNNVFQTNQSNPFNASGARVRFVTAPEGGVIIGAGIKAMPNPFSKGISISFIGDAFVQQSQATNPCTYRLSYAPASQPTSLTSIVSGAPCGKMSMNADVLGTLDTSSVAAGNYIAVLELFQAGSRLSQVQRNFSISP